jgi:sugar lactone lactonase YvrE
MIVTDFAEGQVWRLDLATGSREKLLDIEGILDNSAVGPDDAIYSAAFGDGQIWKIETSGETRPLTNSGLFAAGGVAVEADGSVLVANWFTLNRFTDGEPSHTFYDRFDPQGEGMGGPNTVAVDGENLVLTGYFSNFVQVMNTATGDIVSDDRDVETPTNAIPHDGDIAVAQAGAGNVVRLSDRSVIIDGLELPTGLAADGTTLYVADWATGTIWSAGPGGATEVAFGLNHPEGLAVTDDGTLLVAEEGIDQVTAIDLATGDRRAAAEVELGDHYTPGLIDYGMFTGIALDGNGGFWVTSGQRRPPLRRARGLGVGRRGGARLHRP